MFSKQNKLVIACLLIVLGVLLRTHFHLGENVEFVTSAALLAGSYLGLGWAISIPIITMVVSDSIIGNTNIFLFTWSAYAVIGIMGFLLHKFKIKNSKLKILAATTTGIAASLWFYLWTNFGVWVLDSWGMYPKTFMGLMQAYAMGIPFLKFNLIGNIVLVTLSFGTVEYVTNKILKLKRVDRTVQKKLFV